MVTEILIMHDVGDESFMDLPRVLLERLGYLWLAQPKSSDMAQLAACQLILFSVGRNAENDIGILREIRSQVAYLPIVLVTNGILNIPPNLAKLASSILHLPTTQDVLKKKLLRHLDPRSDHQVRIYDRTDASLKISWRQELGDKLKESMTGNISRGGAFIREGHFFPNRGDVVEVVIRAGRNTISGRAIVRWIYSPGSASNNAPGFGVEFLTLTPSGEALFQSLGLG